MIGAAQGIEANSAVSVWAAVLPGVRVRAFHLEVIRTPQRMAILGLPESAEADDVAVLLADPYTFPADGFVEHTNDALGLPLVGGMATGNRGPGSTRLLLDERIFDAARSAWCSAGRSAPKRWSARAVGRSGRR